MDKFRAFSIAVGAAALLLPSLLSAVEPPPVGGYPGENTATGDGALFSLTTGTNDTADGFDALYNTTTGTSNTAIGHAALFNNTTGSSSTANGESALYSNTTGGANLADGEYTMFNNTTGEFNVAVGYYTLFSNTTADDNTAVGVTALFSNTAGGSNVAMGDSAEYENTTGSRNTGIGCSTLTRNKMGSNNVALGEAALAYLEEGSNNIGIGQDAALKLKSGDWNIYVGNIGVKKKESGTIRIGDPTRNTNAYMAGISGVTVANGATVVVDGNGLLGTVTSSARFKDNIQPMKDASAAILSLKPVTFRYKKELDSLGVPQFGLVAEDVAKVDPDLVIRDDDGKPFTVRYEAVNAMLLNEFLKEHRAAQTERAKVATLEAQGAQLRKTLADLQAALKAQAAQIEKVTAQVQANAVRPRLVSAQP